MGYRDVLGLTATVVAFISFVPYFRDIFARKTNPHAFTWLIWGVLTVIAFFGQLSDHAGAGAWVTGFTALVCLLIAGIAVASGQRTIARVDWIALAGAGIALGIWFLTRGPLLSVIFITVIDNIGFIPTLRKSYARPFEETMSTFGLGGLKWVLGLLALERVSVITVLFPLAIVVQSWLFVVLLVIRRRQRNLLSAEVAEQSQTRPCNAGCP